MRQLRSGTEKTTAPILQANGYAFKDLNRNGQLDVYEDWRKPALERAKDFFVRYLGGKAGEGYHNKRRDSARAPFLLTAAQDGSL